LFNSALYGKEAGNLETETKEAPLAKAQPREELRKRIIVIAEEILAAEGLAALQARAVAARAGCSVGTIYNVFGGIDDVILTANANTLAHLKELLAAVTEASKGKAPQERLLALAFAYLDFASTHKKRWKAVFEHVMSDSRTVPAWYRQAQIPLLATLADALPEGMGADDRALMARTLFSAAHGIVVLSLDKKLADVFDRPLTEKQLRLLVKGAAISLQG
jgi:AcrR family transcriptional regulator